MRRDPDRRPVFVFDLVDDDVAGPDAPAAPDRADGADAAGASDGDEPRPGEPSASGGPGAQRRALAPVAAVLAIALGTALAADGVRDSARIELMRGLHGGVADLSSPLDELWAWDGGVVGTGESGNGSEGEVAALDDVLVFASVDDLVALDPATGDEAWTVPLGADPSCGPMGTSAPDEAAAPSVVCLHGTGADRTAIVVGPDGLASAPRVLDTADARRHGLPRPGPAGTVLRATRVGPGSAVDLGDAECNAELECTGTVEEGRDVVLRAEDAATGRERWSVTVPFRAAEAGQCWETSWADPGNDVSFDGSLDADAFGARITADLVHLDGCGVQAAVTPDGVVLGTEFEPGTGFVERLGTGGYAGLDYGGAARTVLYSDDGAVVAELPGYVAGPSVADGSGSDTLLGADETGRRLRAYGADGTQRWDVAAPGAGPFLAQVGETAVVASWDGTTRGLDVATGDERWIWDGRSDVDGESVGDVFVSQAFTDGESVLLRLTRGDSGASRLVSLDAASGEVLWDERDQAAAEPGSGPEPSATLVAVDGHLLEVTRAGVRGLG
jgi:outer membrane protein assembly factor BamB